MMTPLKSFVALLALVGPAVADDAARVAAVTAWTTDFTAPEPFEARPAGAATVTRFADPAATLDPARRMDFALGAAVFEKLWVAAPSSTRASDGLGPLFNARSCAGCHPGNGRGTPPPTPGAISGLVLKLATPDGHPDPLRGSQLQDRAVPGVPAEGALTLEWSETQVVLAGGEVVALRRPLARVTPDLAPGTQTSLRVAPQLIGLGLLEVVADADILALADPDDADGDGISGRAAWVHSPSLDAQALGRFGHRAGAASLRDMAAAAFSTDMGLSSPLYPDPAGDCTSAQASCRAAPDGEDAGLRDDREVAGDTLDLVAFYTEMLGVPARRTPGDPQVLAGKAAFYDAGCAACHRPKFVTPRLPDDPARSFQLIWPYSDLLLHDMGPGLADAAPDGQAAAPGGGREWRTAPLWGIGLTEAATGHQATYLHDGRARSLREAILWHGGEAAPARDRVARMAPATRAALIAYLESL